MSKFRFLREHEIDPEMAEEFRRERLAEAREARWRSFAITILAAFYIFISLVIGIGKAC